MVVAAFMGQLFYFKARYAQYLKYFPFILKMTFLSPATSLSSPCPRALSLSIY